MSLMKTLGQFPYYLPGLGFGTLLAILLGSGVCIFGVLGLLRVVSRCWAPCTIHTDRHAHALEHMPTNKSYQNELDAR